MQRVTITIDEDLVADFGSVENARGHCEIIAYGKCATGESGKHVVTIYR